MKLHEVTARIFQHGEDAPFLGCWPLAERHPQLRQSVMFFSNILNAKYYERKPLLVDSFLKCFGDWIVVGLKKQCGATWLLGRDNDRQIGFWNIDLLDEAKDLRVKREGLDWVVNNDTR